MTTEEPERAEEPVKKGSVVRWIRLPFRILGRLLVAIALIFYVAVGMTAAIALYKRDVDKSQDITALYKVISDAEASGDVLPVTVWLSSRPLAETDKLVEMMTPKSSALEFGTFFEIFRRELRLNRPEEALFWLQLGRYRLRYDIVRCDEKPEESKIFDQMLDLVPTPAIDELLLAHPEMLKKTLQRVLDFDEKYPAHDNPARVCSVVSSDPPMAEGYWEAYRRGLRKNTEDFIKSPDKADPK